MADDEDRSGDLFGDPDWLKPEDLEALNMEHAVHPEESQESITRRLFRESSPQAALGIIHLAMHSSNERLRLDAQKYVVERVLGKVGDDAYSGEKSPLDNFANLLQDAESHANGGK